MTKCIIISLNFVEFRVELENTTTFPISATKQ